MKTVGIIGGLGPDTTSKFYLEIIAACNTRNKKHRPPVLIWSVPIPYDVEEDLITKSEGEERFIPYLVDGAKRLEKGGADFIVIPCNSVHLFIKEIREAIRIPILSITEETVKFLRTQGITEVGILATPMTIKNKLYEAELATSGIKEITPDSEHQLQIGRVIHNLVMDNLMVDDKRNIEVVLNGFAKQGLKKVILACTDLQLLNLNHPDLEIYDTMKILADATTQKILE